VRKYEGQLRKVAEDSGARHDVLADESYGDDTDSLDRSVADAALYL
jgi:hypothetical protein